MANSCELAGGVGEKAQSGQNKKSPERYFAPRGVEVVQEQGGQNVLAVLRAATRAITMRAGFGELRISAQDTVAVADLADGLFAAMCTHCSPPFCSGRPERLMDTVNHGGWCLVKGYLFMGRVGFACPRWTFFPPERNQVSPNAGPPLFHAASTRMKFRW